MRILTLIVLLAAQTARAQDAFSGVERIVAVGDIHGDHEAFLAILRDAALIDQKSRWSGGKTHLVQTGDLLDRGPDSRKVMELMLALEKQAAKAGGRVHTLIGNHEAMNMYGDLRYTSAGEFAAFKTGDSDRVRDSFWEQESKGMPRPPSAEEKKKWEAEHPLGWVEHRMQFGPEGVYGKWLRNKNAVVKINDSVFLHGGLSAKFAALSLTQMNAAVRAELKDVSQLKTDNSILTDPDGPLWYRGLAQDSGPGILALAVRLTESLGVQRIVIGHTPTPGAVLPRLGGRVVSIDVGMSAYYGSHRACLVIEGDKLYAMHRGRKIELPSLSSEGGGAAAYLAYVKRVAALEKPGSLLMKYAAQVEAQLAGTR